MIILNGIKEELGHIGRSFSDCWKRNGKHSPRFSSSNVSAFSLFTHRDPAVEHVDRHDRQHRETVSQKRHRTDSTVSQNHATEYLVTYSNKVSVGSDGSPPQVEIRGVMVNWSSRKNPQALNFKITLIYIVF